MAVKTSETHAITEATQGETTADIKSVELFHEWSSTPSTSSIEENIPIDPMHPPSAVVVRSTVRVQGNNRTASPEYLASIRRRRAKRIATSVRELERHVEKQEFAVWTQRPLQELRLLIQELTDAEQLRDREFEGNSCEVFRQIRDTLLDTGWKLYREPLVRSAVISILDHLGNAAEVTADDADRAADQLLDVGLNPAVGLAFINGEEDEIPC